MSRQKPWILPVVFSSGAAVLAYEIVGARLLSPVFGATLPVWSSIFAVTLLSLSVGYALGGIVAERHPPDRVLGAALSGAGLWMTLVPWMRYSLLNAAMGWGVSVGAVGAASIFLGPPLILLGMTGPLALRLLAREDSHIGRDTGHVSAVSTGGSVVGALAAGYWLLPLWDGTVVTVVMAALVSILAAFVWSRTKRAGFAVIFATVALFGPCLFTLRQQEDYGKVLERAESFYGTLRVMEHPSWGKRVMYIDGIANTVVGIDTLDSTSDYVSGIELSVFMRPREQMSRALLIGLGGGSIVGRFDRNYGIKTDVVEIDSDVRRLASTWFDFKPTGEVFIEDARTFLRRDGIRYDLIVGDAFSGDSHPAHLYSVEAFQDIKRRLTANGIFVMNVIGYMSGPQAGLKRAVAKTLLSEFKNVSAIASNQGVEIDKDPINMIFFASDGSLDYAIDPAIAARQELQWFYKSVRGQNIDLEAERGEFITDARNPVNRLNSPVFIDIRQRIFESRGRLLLD